MNEMIEKIARAMADKSSDRTAGIHFLGKVDMSGEENFYRLAQAAMEVMANEKEKHHGDDEYDVLVDGNFVKINIGPDQRAWLPISIAPKTGQEIIARVSSQYASFSCFWDGKAFAHYCNGSGIVYYSPKEWKPMSEGAAQ